MQNGCLISTKKNQLVNKSRITWSSWKLNLWCRNFEPWSETWVKTNLWRQVSLLPKNCHKLKGKTSNYKANHFKLLASILLMFSGKNLFKQLGKFGLRTMMKIQKKFKNQKTMTNKKMIHPLRKTDFKLWFTILITF